MRGLALNLAGLAIGTVLAGGGLMLVGPGHLGSTTVGRVAQRAAAAVGEGSLLPHKAAMPRVTMPAARPEAATGVVQPQGRDLPQVIYPGGKSASAAQVPHVVPVSMPNVIGPTQMPNSAPPPPPGTVLAGTGFFIGSDGSLLTASHVVHQCRRIGIVSRTVRLTDVERLAEDRMVDVALLRARRAMRPPAVLALASTRPTSDKLFVLGYPATASLRIPDETWATLDNARVPAALGHSRDSRQTVWLQSNAVTHGYSGGPMFDPDIGAVAGLVKAGIERKYLFQVSSRVPSGNLSFGPGAARLAAFVQRVDPDLPLADEPGPGDATLDDVRRATVHVLCWR